MKKKFWWIVVAVTVMLGLASGAASGALPARVTWEYTDQGYGTYLGFFSFTPEGTVLATRNGFQEPAVLELNMEGEILWEYGPIQANSAVSLPNGNILIADSGAPGYPLKPRVIEVNKEGEILWSFELSGREESPRVALPLTGEKFLLVLANRVVEIDRTGKVFWEYGDLLYPVWAERLADGNTLIVDRGFFGGQVLEIDRQGEPVWTYGDYGSPEGAGELYRPVWATRLADGSTLISDRGRARLVKVLDGEEETVEQWQEVITALPVADRWMALPDLNREKIYLSLTLSGGRSVLWQVEREIKTFLRGEPYSPGTSPVLLDGILYGGARELLDLVGGEVTWQADTRELEILHRGRMVTVTVDSSRGVVDGKPVKVTPPIIRGGTALLPLDFVRDYFGLDYEWEEGERKLNLLP